ncbi:phd finger-like domain-containing protein 5a [Holotrichia oblita]|uniref:Phd finger-like domain-containing protein 5a n=1 Tax=Holotrichia oblita TaxID=644536 RepID=A0ACB9T1T0_HOLOL|nr:phd finger-like domain-containing protein 5a [Holotrichia oblita]
MAKHHPDLIFCRKQPGVAIGRLCEKCDGKCVICDSYVRPCTLVRICDECNYGSYQGRCVICGGPGVSDAYYCKECTIQEKDRDGCPKIVNLGSSKTDLFYERKKWVPGQKSLGTAALDELGDLSEYLQRSHITVWDADKAIRTTISVFNSMATKVGPKLAAALPDLTKQIYKEV